MLPEALQIALLRVYSLDQSEAGFPGSVGAFQPGEMKSVTRTLSVHSKFKASRCDEAPA